MRMYRRKALVAIADGLGDRPVEELGGLTPLQKARTPNLDRVAREGGCGIMDLLAPGVPVGTDMGHLLLFGGNGADYPGRGPVEARGINMDVADGDVLFRCNFATVDKNGVVKDRRAGRINGGTKDLAQALDGLGLGDGVRSRFAPATEHRGVLILRGPGLGGAVTDTDPKVTGKPVLAAQATDGSPEAARTAEKLNLFLRKSAALLAEHPVNAQRAAQGELPANALLTRGAGRFRGMAQQPELLGFSGCCVAGEATVLGMARLLGYETVTDPAFSANPATDYARKAAAALEALSRHDLVFVHFKATDLAGHDNQPWEKVKAIEMFDAMVGLLLAQLPPKTCLALASDHSTPCEVGEHSGEPVPVAILGPGIRRDEVERFDEIACGRGCLSRIRGRDFIMGIFDYMGVSKKRGS